MIIEYSAMYKSKCDTLLNKLQYRQKWSFMMRLFPAMWLVDVGGTPLLRIAKAKWRNFAYKIRKNKPKLDVLI